MFRHVLCVYPYRRELNDTGFFPPLGLECIARVIEPFAQAIDIVDLRKETGVATDFLRPDTDLVCFSVNWDRDQDFLRQQILSAPPGPLIVLGGRHATENPDQWLKDCPNAGVVIRGDGEEAMEELCRGLPLERIAGLSFRANGRIVHNPNRSPGPVRDDLFPNRRLRKYRYDIALAGVGTGLEIDTISASRGCPFNCSFCSFNRNPWGTRRKWSARSPESVVAELEQVRARMVGFSDDLFTHDMDRVERICDLIVERRIRKNYIINARLEIARRPDILRKMHKAGFFLLMLGIESAQDKTLHSMQKGFNTRQIREYCKVLNRSGMLLHGYFMLGNIGESTEEMRQILPFARELGLDTMALSMLRVSPYSGLEKLVAASPGYHVAPSGKVYSDQNSLKDLRNIRRKIARQFYGPSQILQILRKGLRMGAARFLPDLALRIPAIGWNVAMHLRRRAKRKDVKRAALLRRAPGHVSVGEGSRLGGLA